MAKRTGENQDYYKHAGQSPSRRILARERQTLSEARASESSDAGGGPRFGKKPAVKATGAGVKTAELGQRKRAQKQAEAIERDQVTRMLEAEAPIAPPNRQLPAATASTELQDFMRSVAGSARTARDAGREALRASRTLRSSLGDLALAPFRLMRLLVTVGA